MLLSQKTSVKLTENAANFIGHMCYAAYKLWNVCNYERYHYKELSLKEYPDWYYQKKSWKDSLWFKQLPSQTAQEVCKLLDKSWKSFIVGRKYLSFCHRYYKEIARVQSQWYSQQVRRGMRYRKSSRHIKKLYEKKKNVIRDYLHKITRYVVEYCKREKIHTVIMGDLKNIRKEKRLGNITNQKLHELPFDKIKQMLSYKLKKEGICFILQNETYTSQCSPVSPEVKKEYGQKENRKKRGLYREVDKIYNADAVGAYNILRKYLKISGIEKELSLTGIERTWIIKVAV